MSSAQAKPLSNPFNQLPSIDEPEPSATAAAAPASSDPVLDPDIKIILLGDSAVGKSK